MLFKGARYYGCVLLGRPSPHKKPVYNGPKVPSKKQIPTIGFPVVFSLGAKNCGSVSNLVTRQNLGFPFKGSPTCPLPKPPERKTPPIPQKRKNKTLAARPFEVAVRAGSSYVAPGGRVVNFSASCHVWMSRGLTPNRSNSETNLVPPHIKQADFPIQSRHVAPFLTRSRFPLKRRALGAAMFRRQEIRSCSGFPSVSLFSLKTAQG